MIRTTVIVSCGDEVSIFMYIYVKPQQTKDGASAISSVVVETNLLLQMGHGQFFSTICHVGYEWVQLE